MSVSQDHGSPSGDTLNKSGNDHDLAFAHSLYTVPPYVAEDSMQDRCLCTLAVLTGLALVSLMIYWGQLPI